MKIRKYSRQRESLKHCLSIRCDHPTADALYASIREEFPNISLGTVYRNLNLLVELGEIQKLSFGDGADRFDARVWLRSIIWPSATMTERWRAMPPPFTEYAVIVQGKGPLRRVKSSDSPDLLDFYKT